MPTAPQQPNPLENYETVPDEVWVAVEALLRIYDRVGLHPDMRAEDIAGSEVALRFVEELVDVWVRLYPSEANRWFDSIEKELQVEKTVREQVRGETGQSILSIPPHVYNMFKVFFPEANLANKRLSREIARRVKKLKATNYEI